MTRPERLQLESAARRLEAMWATVPEDMRADVAYVAARLDKVLTGHASYR